MTWIKTAAVEPGHYWVKRDKMHLPLPTAICEVQQHSFGLCRYRLMGDMWYGKPFKIAFWWSEDGTTPTPIKELAP